MPKVMTEPEKNKDEGKKAKNDARILAEKMKSELTKSRTKRRYGKRPTRRTALLTREKDFRAVPFGCAVTATESSYEFSTKDVFEMYLRSREFREIIGSGNYIYVDGRWILKSTKCIEVKNGSLQTCVPHKNLDDYCLFRTVLTVPLIPAGTGIDPKHCRAEKLQCKIYSFKNAERIDSITKINNNNLYLFFGGGQEPPNNFNGAVVYYMDSRGVTVETLAGETGLSEKTIQRMRTNENIQPTLESIVAFSVGLGLSTYQSDYLLHLAGYSLTPKPIHQAYSLCLNMASSSTVEECNYFLIQLGYKPLTDLYDKEKAKELPHLINSPPIKHIKPKNPREK